MNGVWQRQSRQRVAFERLSVVRLIISSFALELLQQNICTIVVTLFQYTENEQLLEFAFILAVTLMSFFSSLSSIVALDHMT